MPSSETGMAKSLEKTFFRGGEKVKKFDFGGGQGIFLMGGCTIIV